MTDETDVPPEGGYVVAMTHAWADGDNDRFQMLALQFAAHMARTGSPKAGLRLRGIVDGRADRTAHMPRYTGTNKPCVKCRCVFGAAVKYVCENGVEFMERGCEQCGYTWYERRADAKDDE